MNKPDVIIVGGGLAGLTCAVLLHRNGKSVRLFEAESEIGGRVRTKEVDGFLLDRGFQIFLTSYPEARELLDYKQLNFQYFEHGARVFDGTDFYTVHDPLVHPNKLIETLTPPPGKLTDRLKMLRLRMSLALGATKEELSTEEALRTHWRFSDSMIEEFFRPFLGGIMLDRSLSTSSKMFEFIFRMFSHGRAVLPAKGIQAIPRQLADELPDQSIRVNSTIVDLRSKGVKLRHGSWAEAGQAVVLATDAPSASTFIDESTTDGRTNHTLYFAAPRPPYDEPLLTINGSGNGVVNTVSVQSNVARTYAPLGLALVSVSLVDYTGDPGDVLTTIVRNELRDWFGESVDSWEHVHTDEIEYALPIQTPPMSTPGMKIGAHGVIQCGDYLSTGSINGAMESGRKAAEFLLKQ